MPRSRELEYTQRLSEQLDQEFLATFQKMMATEFMELMAGFYEGVQVIAYQRALRVVAKERGLAPADLAAITEDFPGKRPSFSREESPSS